MLCRKIYGLAGRCINTRSLHGVKPALISLQRLAQGIYVLELAGNSLTELSLLMDVRM